MQGENRTGAILVVGSGVAGLQAAVDLAASGCRVYVIDRAPLLGGLMPQLDKTFPTNDCAMCLIAPKEEDRSGCLRGGVAVGRHPNIRVMPNTELQRLDGEAGNFRAGLLTRPRFIDPSRCTACGKCTEVCPESAINEFNAGLDRRAAAYLPFPQAVPHVFAIDRTACTDCGLCVEACPVAAVNFGEQPEERELHVAAVVLAPGNEVFHPAAMKQYLYGLHPNVITSLEYERLYSGTGPHLGQLQRPSDRTPPKKIAWLQCIGSRDIHSHTYCSSVCCMYAIKEALIAKERLPEGVDAAIFYMDMRVCGKDYEQYYQRAREAYGVRFLCYRVPSIAPGADGDLTIEYFDADGQKQAELFNMVVLSVGFQVSAPARELAARLGIHLDRHAYPITDPCLPVASSRPGVYVCGAFQAPKDIPESVTEASAAAACCRAILPADSRTRMPDAPQASSPAAGSRRLGIFFCGCGPDLVEQLDMAELQNYAATLPGVVVAAGLPLDCAPASLADLAKIAAAERLDRAVVAACHPVMQDPEIIEAFRKAGLNRYLVEVVNLRGEVAWVHPDDKDRATAKARDLLRRAAARMLSLHPLPEKTLPLEQSALVLGGGVAGLNAALNLAQQGFGVFLLEKDKVLGGVADRLHRTIEGVDVKAYLDKLIAEVTSHEGIEVLTEARILRHLGSKGSFRTTVVTGSSPAERILQHGAVILATGGGEHRPRGFFYGEDRRVMTQLELGERLRADPHLASSWERVAMIQCVGSRNPENPTCSRICCQSAVKHALELKNRAPQLDVVIFHRDVRTYGLLEDYYTQARDRKVLFERFDPDRAPELVREGEKLKIKFWDAILGRTIQWPVDAVILSAAVEAADTGELARRLGLSQDAQGFFREFHPKLRPVDALMEGYYICGLAHSPRLLKEAVTQGLAAAGRAGAFLADISQKISPLVAHVEQGRCVACLACVRSCPYHIPRINEAGRSEINDSLCLGCGVCATVCPAQAIGFSHYEDEQLRAEISAL